MELRDKNGLTEQEFLAAYKPGDYERPSLTADIAVFSRIGDSLKLLLIKRGGHPFLGFWALPGGFAEKNESIEETAARELTEETSLKELSVYPVGLFSKPGRDPRTWVVSEAFTAVIPKERINEVEAADDAAAAEWFSLHIERKDNIYRLYFSSKNGKFKVQLQKSQEDLLASPKFVVEENGGLAFDHAEIIAHSLNKLGYI